MRFIGDKVYLRATGEAGVVVEYVLDKYRVRLSVGTHIVCSEHELIQQYVCPSSWKELPDLERANLIKGLLDRRL